MNIVQALNQVKTDLLNFVTTNLKNKADIGHTHSLEDISGGILTNDALPIIPLEKGGTNASDGATGLSNLFAAGDTVLSSHQYGDTLPDARTAGRIFFKKVGS